MKIRLKSIPKVLSNIEIDIFLPIENPHPNILIEKLSSENPTPVLTPKPNLKSKIETWQSTNATKSSIPVYAPSFAETEALKASKVTYLIG